MNHSLSIKSVGNARELGGFTADGRSIKHGLLLRTASLSDISAEDAMTMSDTYKLSVIVDLRMDKERQLRPDPVIAAAANHFLPVMDLKDFPDLGSDFARILADSHGDRIELMKAAFNSGYFGEDFYVRLIMSERGKQAFRGLFDCLLNLPDDRSILFHCTDGKDRTGLASMLILTALGADRETIMEDYMLTNIFNKEKLDRVSAGLEKMDITPEFREIALFGSGAVYENYMLNALKALDENYGSPAGFIKEELGIGQDECQILQKKFLE